MEVAEWLRRLDLERYQEAFRENDISEAILPTLTAEDLKDIGVVSVGHRRQLLEAIAALRPDAATAGDTARGERSNSDPASPSVAERRQLAVMFCDMIGFTALSSRLDPEDLSAVIRGYQAQVATTIARFGGFIARYVGDGVLIYFGWPEAHEANAERAVRAALAVVDAVGQTPVRLEPLQVRIGIAIGLVVVGEPIGTGEARQQTAIGETPNRAARLQGLAAPNSIVIDAVTRRQIGGLFDCRDFGLVALKGLPEPVQAWEILGEAAVESRFEAFQAGGMTPLIGREEELELLVRRWQQAKTGEGRVVLVSGEPGIGKSRLTTALSQHIADEPHTRLRYFCAPYHQDSALHPFIAQLERAAKFARNDTAEQKLSKLEAIIAKAARDHDEITLIAELLTLPNAAEEMSISSQRKRKKLFEALLRQLEAIAEQRPALFVFEDAHWLDPTSRELLDLTIERVPDLPVLAVITFRPEFQPPWVGQPQVTTLTLNRLSGRDGAAIIERLAGSTGVPTGLIAEIVERADGVPLFIEELTKVVLENAGQSHRVAAVLSATPNPAIPATLHASLIARLDRLGAAAREAAQIGSVLGREFAYELIQPVAQRDEIDLQASLAQLTEAGLLFCRGAPPYASYLFKHALVQDAAYSTLLRARRQELHARAAAILEQHFDDLVERQPEVLARHFTEAHELDKAVANWSRAGQQAVAKGSLVEAMEQLRRGLRLAEELPDTPKRNQHILDCRLTLAYALLAAKGYSHSDVLRAFEQAAEAASAFEGIAPLDRFSILYGLFSVYYVRGEAEPSLTRATEFLALAETQPLSAPKQIGHRLVGTALMMNADCQRALPHLQRAICLHLPTEHRTFAARFGQDIGVASCSLAAWTRWFCGSPDQASRMADEARRQAKRTGHAHSLNFALFWSCATGCLLRRPGEVEAHADESIELAERHGFQFWAAVGRVYQCWAAAHRPMAPGVIDSFRASLVSLKNSGCRLLEPFYLGLLAEVCCTAGEFDEGLAALDEAFAVSIQTGQTGFDAELHRLRGELMRKLPNADLATCETCFHEALSIARQQGAAGYELRAATSLARLWGELGRHEARDLLARVYGRFTEGFDTADLAEARDLIDALV